MFVLIGLQNITLLLLAAVVWLGWSAQAAFSLLLGGFSYGIPTFIAVLILKFLQPYPVLAGSAFIAAEILKIVLALVLMLLAFWLYSGLQFVPYFIGLLSVSHFVFLFFLKVHRYGK